MPRRRLKDIREDYNDFNEGESNIGQKEIGEILGCSKSTVSRFETDDNYPPDAKQLELYHKLFGVSYDYMMDDSVTLDDVKAANLVYKTGLNKNALKTLKRIRDLSTDENNLSAVINAILYNEEYAVIFIQTIFDFIYNEYTSGQNDINDSWLKNNITSFLKHIVMPKLKRSKSLEGRKDYDECISSTPSEELHKDDYGLTPEMIDELQDEYNKLTENDATP